jgi:hypothetical protein
MHKIGNSVITGIPAQQFQLQCYRSILDFLLESILDRCVSFNGIGEFGLM